MKKIFQLAFVCAGFGILTMAASCSSNYDATPDIPGRDTTKNAMRGDFTAIVDGVNFTANWKYTSDVTMNGVRTISISGIMDSKVKDPQTNQTISLTITNYMGPGTYPIQLGTAGMYTNMVDGVATSYLAKTGDSAAVITITADQGNMQGTFNFVTAPNGLGDADNHPVTAGSFDVPK